MKKLYIKAIAILVACSLGFAACDDYLDINVDPNNPPTSTPALTLPAGQGELAYVLGNQFQFLGNFFAQHWTQAGAANQYCDLELYQITSSDYDARVWGELYAGALEDFKFVADQAEEDGNPNAQAVGKIMQVYTMQVITDAWGDVPYTSALSGLENQNPEYQPQQEIYDRLVMQLDSALMLIDEGTDSGLGGADLVYGGDMGLWRRFANTLKLKVYLRQAYVRPDVAQSGIQAMYADGAEFLQMGQTADVEFADQTQNRNPFYQTQVVFRGGVDVVASNTSISYLQQTGDPRINALYNPAETGPDAGSFVGVEQGVECTPERSGNQSNTVSKPGPAVASPTTAVPFITAAESYFLQAEAVARGWTGGAGGNAGELYAQGIRASFDYLGLAPEQAEALLQQEGVAYTTSGDVEAQVEQILTQKWVSFNGVQGFESWTEYRRTGYPSFIQPSAASTLGTDLIPKRLVYPNTEAIRNQNYPGLVEISEPVWWDKKD
ncbi:SusD/RagB family nutrient-binding outer membrane lipoprotein [Pontibacter mangrovi]|uniref:SusD/RagB family nutrient-binding outer membrane lipoprotein n=1 Tax=Pontibacter mangrovi TaxID=2589816 RepID=A0A501W358_9BACT|nr:SusD/RagB family nutrient-binding outer membrane lipoprotein [Pontibacter mangrovi]TPE43718.1 SusD/RagB family nutrient-binding outer membrane lipoprotein [Pontibacter mangrovi]